MTNRSKANFARRLARSIQHRNIYQTLVNGITFFWDIAFDWRHNIETINRFEIKKGDTIGANEAFAVSYSPTRVVALRKCFQTLNLPSEGSFVDLGAGKGRALIVASEVGFQKIIGVEFSKYLSDIARRNIDQYKVRSDNLADINIYHADVVDYVWNDDENVVFMFHSFGERVLNIVIRNIEDSLARTPRMLWLIYQNPVHKDLIEENYRFEFFRQFRLCGNKFCVYRAKSLCERERTTRSANDGQVHGPKYGAHTTLNAFKRLHFQDRVCPKIALRPGRSG